MTSPRVSILLPNLNNRPYLEERMQTILAQTFTDWELVIVDNYSDDGAWEFFQQYARQDQRIKLSRAPRAGMYANWNNCINLAKGEYVYIATSDDTMSPDFLELMVAALDEYTQCDLAHCKLKIIDENGDDHPKLSWERFYCKLYFGKLIDAKHIRLAPHDGLLHCGLRTVYTSITQLLTRRNLFDKIGLFRTDFGSTADFEWDMRASLLANTIHIPRYLATWRVHRDQGTDLGHLHSAKHHAQLIQMMDQALKTAKKIDPAMLNEIDIKHLKYLYHKEIFRYEGLERNKRIDRFKTVFKWLRLDPRIVFEWFFRVKLQKKRFIPYTAPLDFARSVLRRYGFENNIKLVPSKKSR